MSTKNFKTIDKIKIEDNSTSNINFSNEDFYREKNKNKESIILPKNDFALKDNNKMHSNNETVQLIRNNRKSSQCNTTLSVSTNVSQIKNEKSKPKYKAENLKEIDDRLRIRSDLVFPVNEKKIIIQNTHKLEKKENVRTSSPFLEKVKHIMDKEGKSFSTKNLVQPVTKISKEKLNISQYKTSPLKNIVNLHLPNQSRTIDTSCTKINPEKYSNSNSNDYFMQIFRNASSQNINVKNLIDKVTKVNQKQNDIIKNKYLSNLSNPCNGQFDSAHSYEKEKNDLSINIFERDISSTENIGNKYEKNEKEKSLPFGNDSFIRYEANSEKDKDLYVQSLKKNLQEFSHRKHEVKKNREKIDMFEELSEQIDNIVKKIHHEDHERSNLNRVDVDQVNQIGEKYIISTEKEKTFDSEKNSPEVENIKIVEKVINKEDDQKTQGENGKNISKENENKEMEQIKIYPNNVIPLSGTSSKPQGKKI
jgi:hypothetical protein